MPRCCWHPRPRCWPSARGLLIARWRQPGAFLLVLAAVGVLGSGGILLDAATIPNFAHWAPVFPVFYLALALPVALLLQALRRLDRRLWLAACTVAVLALTGDAVANAHSYLVDYPLRVPADHSLEALVGRFVEGLPQGTRWRVVGPTWQPLRPGDREPHGPGQIRRQSVQPEPRIAAARGPVLAARLYFLPRPGNGPPCGASLLSRRPGGTPADPRREPGGHRLCDPGERGRGPLWRAGDLPAGRQCLRAAPECPGAAGRRPAPRNPRNLSPGRHLERVRTHAGRGQRALPGGGTSTAPRSGSRARRRARTVSSAWPAAAIRFQSGPCSRGRPRYSCRSTPAGAASRTWARPNSGRIPPTRAWL